MTEVNGLRLAYRGLIAGLAGGYVWAAIAMLLSALADGDPLRPLRPIALAFSPIATSPELAFVLGLAAIQGGGALIGMCFAYFFARFFTVRATLAIAAPVFTILIWGLVAAVVTRDTGIVEFATHPIPALASLGYGILVGAAV
ncbi:MAG: hypothetical protein WKH68_03990, partial [Candidatus Limnocylindria bacterium]